MNRISVDNTSSELPGIYYSDDTDSKKAGQGLASAPFIQRVLEQVDLTYWEMSPAEQMAMVYLLSQRRPKVGIEIGTRYGGSLQVLARYCDHVYSIDIDPEVPRRLSGKYSNVEYITGPSGEMLPALLAKLSKSAEPVGFILVDGDHSAQGVKADIDNILNYQLIDPLYVVMHDSFNPECRRGLVEACWSACPNVHAVELDFVPGVVNPSPAFCDQLWGGLALGILLPEARQGRFEITGRANRTFERVVSCERHGLLRRRLRALFRFLRTTNLF